jgi:polar amino acid transport system substrate-binding protein
MRNTLSLAALLSAGLILTACSGGAGPTPSDDPAGDDAAQGGELRIGNSAVYPPMSFLPEDDERPEARTGFDVDLATAIAEELGMEPVFEQQSYEQYLPSLGTGRLDMVQSAMQDLPDRRETVDFVDYLLTGPQLFTTADRTDLAAVEDLCGGSVVLDTGDVGYRDALAEASGEVCGVDEQIEVVSASGTADALLQLTQGRADATIRGAEAVSYLIDSGEEGQFAAIGEPLTELPVGIAVAKDNTELRDRIADALQALMDDGTYQELLDTWSLADLALPAVMVNGEERG